MSSRNPKSKISDQCFDDGLMMLEQRIPKVDALEQRLDAGQCSKFHDIPRIIHQLFFICYRECVSKHAYNAI